MAGWTMWMPVYDFALEQQGWGRTNPQKVGDDVDRICFYVDNGYWPNWETNAQHLSVVKKNVAAAVA